VSSVDCSFLRFVKSNTDVNALLKLREELKDRVTSPELNWQSRMDIYKKVQLITERIEQLQYRKDETLL
jgi:hypothetical protein